MKNYCVYLTIYRGNKLPPFYIGSTSVANINNGYRGSVCSRDYRGIWKSEIKEHPELFKTVIIAYSNTRKEATLREREIHLRLKVNTSPLYINRNLASPDGACGVSLKGKDNPMYGKPRLDVVDRNKSRKGSRLSKEHREKISKGTSGANNPMYGKNHTDEAKKKMSEAVTGRTYHKVECEFCSKEIASNNLDNHIAVCKSNPNRFQKFKHKLPRSAESRQKISEIRKNQEKIKCPHCGGEATPPNAKRWHFDNCKLKPELIG